MSFVVIVACLAVQWFLNFNSAAYEFQWAALYYQWINKQFSALEKGHGLFAVLLLVLPPVIVVSLIFTIAYHLFGHVGYLVLSLLLLWYCLNVTILKSTTASTDIFLKGYQKIFAPLFWYFVFGPVGLALYVIVATLRVQSTNQKYFVLTQGVLDWVPIRLTGLTFALAGNFGAVFKVWIKEVFHAVWDNQNQVLTFGDAALTGDSDAVSLVRRALLIWVVMIALITLGSWLG